MKTTAYSSALERGILTSSYKEDVKYSFKHLREKSIFTARERARETCSTMTCSIAVAVKVVLVVLVLASIIL